jgi:hypothetical protein
MVGPRSCGLGSTLDHVSHGEAIVHEGKKGRPAVRIVRATELDLIPRARPSTYASSPLATRHVDGDINGGREPTSTMTEFLASVPTPHFEEPFDVAPIPAPRNAASGAEPRARGVAEEGQGAVRPRAVT